MWQDDPYETEIEEIRARQARILSVISPYVLERGAERVAAVTDPCPESRSIVERELRRSADALLDDAVVSDLDALRTARSGIVLHEWAFAQGHELPPIVESLVEDDKVARAWRELQSRPPSTELRDLTELLLLAQRYAAGDDTAGV